MDGEGLSMRLSDMFLGALIGVSLAIFLGAVILVAVIR
jgi:hypothetical protein